jgi:hypothetical protein
MRPIIIGLFVAVMAAALTPAAVAFAASAPVKVAPPVDPDKRARGKSNAPAVIAAAGLDCTLADAQQMGVSTDPKTKVESTFYELACKGNEGFVIAMHKPVGAAPATAPDIYTCLEVASSPAACILPGNLDPKSGLAPIVSKVDAACVLANAKGVGHATDGSKTVFEVACQDGSGFMLETSFPVSPAKPAKLIPCYIYNQTSNVKCSLTDDASASTYVDRLTTQAVKDCVTKDRRFMGASAAGEFYYEVACQNGQGYIIGQGQDLSITKTISCEDTDQCTLTDVRAHKSEQAGLYTKLAQAGGFDCTVAEYAPFTANLPGHEVVELSCSNRPDGAVAIFAASTSEKPVFYDCAHSELEGYRCGITKPEAALAAMTADLKSLGKNSCTVSASRFLGLTTDGHGYVEVACADGLPGYTVEYTVKPLAPSQAFPCTGAPPVNGTCQLPGNSKK